MVAGIRSVLDGQTLGRLDRWRKARAVFIRPDGPEAERAVSQALGRTWTRAPIYGRARRILVDRSAEKLLSSLEEALGPLAPRVRVAPEDAAQTKWDAMGNLAPLPGASQQVRALWLADAIQSGSLFVEFQPVFLLSNADPFGFEGLLRARAPDGSVRLAAELFPAAHALRIENEFERISWVCVLEAAGRLPNDSLLFLNVNPRLLISGEEGLAALGQEAERMQFPYTRLALDLVEIERVQYLERLRPALTVPRDLGISIALDDVTSGYDTIRYCEGLAPEWIKVDSEITRGIAGDSRRRAILKFLTQVAGASFRLIAEGVETAEDLDVCEEEGVTAAQGYFLARPAVEPGGASADFQRWLSRRARPEESVTAEPSSAPAGGEADPDF